MFLCLKSNKDVSNDMVCMERRCSAGNVCDCIVMISCSLVLAERPLKSRFGIGACDVMLWKYVP